jgi:hypothetical protein
MRIRRKAGEFAISALGRLPSTLQNSRHALFNDLRVTRQDMHHLQVLL